MQTLQKYWNVFQEINLWIFPFTCQILQGWGTEPTKAGQHWTGWLAHAAPARRRQLDAAPPKNSDRRAAADELGSARTSSNNISVRSTDSQSLSLVVDSCNWRWHRNSGADWMSSQHNTRLFFRELLACKSRKECTKEECACPCRDWFEVHGHVSSERL